MTIFNINNIFENYINISFKFIIINSIIVIYLIMLVDYYRLGSSI